MQAGQIISGVFHGALLVLVGVGIWDSPPEPRDMVSVADVTMISAEMLDAQSSAPPQVSPEASLQSVPEPVAEAPTAPVQDVAPQASEAEAVEAPQIPDIAADLTPIRRLPTVSSPVSMDTPAFEQPQMDVAPTTPQISFQGNERNTDVTALTPPPPRAAPRIDTRPAEAPPPEAEIAPEVQQETTPVETPVETPVVEVEEPATAPVESTSQIQPEAQPDAEISAQAPELAAMPVRRPRNMEAAAQAVEAAAEMSRRVAEEARAAAANAAEDAAIADEAAAINAALEAAQAEVNAEDAQSASLSGPEVGAISAAIAANWNKQLILEQPGYEQYIVRVSVSIDSSGRVETVTPFEPSDPTGYFRVAYDSAERAVSAAGRLPLPTDRFPNGVTLILTFDPLRGIGFN